MMKHFQTAFALGLSGCALALSGCAVTSPQLGAAMNHNTDIQAIAPTPEQKQNTYIPADAARQKLARDNYRKNEVKELRQLRTQDE